MFTTDPPPDARPSVRAPRVLWSWLVPLLVVVIAALMILAYQINLSHHERREIARLQAIAQLKTEQIDRWYKDRLHEAAFIPGRHNLGDSIWQWIKSGDKAAHTQVQGLLREYQSISAYHSVLLIDAAGRLLGGVGETQDPVAPELRAVVRRALSEPLPDGATKPSAAYRLCRPAPVGGWRPLDSGCSARACRPVSLSVCPIVAGAQRKRGNADVPPRR